MAYLILKYLKRSLITKFLLNIGKVVSKINKKNQILHSSNNAPEVLISSEKKNKKDLRTIKNVLSKIRLKVKIKSKNSDVIWSKLIRLSPISALTALYNCNLGQIRSSKLKMDQLNTLIKETLIISKKNDNYRDSYTNVKNLIKSLPDKLNTSLQRDINSGVSSELETQIGSIVKLSKKLNISSPMNEKIYLLLKKMSKRF